MYFALRLTYPEPVTELNFKEMAAAVQNGAHVHPGALYIEDENGHMTDLSYRSDSERLALSKLLKTFGGNKPGHCVKKSAQTC